MTLSTASVGFRLASLATALHTCGVANAAAAPTGPHELPPGLYRTTSVAADYVSTPQMKIKRGGVEADSVQSATVTADIDGQTVHQQWQGAGLAAAGAPIAGIEALPPDVRKAVLAGSAQKAAAQKQVEEAMQKLGKEVPPPSPPTTQVVFEGTRTWERIGDCK